MFFFLPLFYILYGLVFHTIVCFNLQSMDYDVSENVLYQREEKRRATKVYNCDEFDHINVLFNITLNTFYLRLYGVRHMVKDHSDSEKGNLLSLHRLLLSINSKSSFICTIPQTG